MQIQGEYELKLIGMCELMMDTLINVDVRVRGVENVYVRLNVMC